jgi:stage II sporulation protein M
MEMDVIQAVKTRRSHNYGMELKRWLLIATALFGGGLLLGLLLPSGTADEIIKTFEDLAGDAASVSGLGLFVFLLINNTIAVLVSFFFSPLFLILPVVSLLANGAVISVVARLTLENHSAAFLMAGILPHGIIEIPAYLLAQAAALSFGFAVLRGFFKSDRRASIGPTLRTSLRWLGAALLLLIPAALIESFITPLFIGLFE